MAKTKRYGHFCPSAHTLEIIGDKWLLLIVRDLLPGPRRYTDLLGSLQNITSSVLLARLRDLEHAGILKPDRAQGRREVWYSLTDKGSELAPVLTELATWGTKHAIRPPLHDEAVHPQHVINALIFFLKNRLGMRLAPVIWVFRFPGDYVYTIRFTGKRWKSNQGEDAADVLIETTPEALAMLITAGQEESRELIARLEIKGKSPRLDEFISAFAGQVTSPSD